MMANGLICSITWMKGQRWLNYNNSNNDGRRLESLHHLRPRTNMIQNYNNNNNNDGRRLESLHHLNKRQRWLNYNNNNYNNNNNNNDGRRLESLHHLNKRQRWLNYNNNYNNNNNNSNDGRRLESLHHLTSRTKMIQNYNNMNNNNNTITYMQGQRRFKTTITTTMTDGWNGAINWTEGQVLCCRVLQSQEFQKQQQPSSYLGHDWLKNGLIWLVVDAVAQREIDGVIFAFASTDVP